jgi:hypothetical protein
VWLAPLAVTLGALGVVAVAWTRAVRRFKETGPSATGDEHDQTTGGRDGQDGVLADQTASMTTASMSKEGSSS